MNAKTFIKSEKRLIHESSFRFLRVGVRSWMLLPEMRLAPAVILLNVDGFDMLVKIPWQLFCCFLSKQTLYWDKTFIIMQLFCTFLYKFAFTSALRWQEPIYDPPLKHNIRRNSSGLFISYWAMMKYFLHFFLFCWLMNWELAVETKTF